MARLIYSAISSLDGYIEDMNGEFDWAAPDEEVHGFINNLERSAGTHLYGRRMYETLMVWETDPNLAAESPLFARLCRDLAGRGQNRVLQNIGGCIHSQDAIGAKLQSDSHSTIERGCRTRYPHWWSRAGCPCLSSGVDRRVPLVSHTDHRRRGQTIAPGQRSIGA